VEEKEKKKDEITTTIEAPSDSSCDKNGEEIA
jgi:hypothetical protein